MDETKKEDPEEDLVWERCGSNSLLIQGFDEILDLLSHIAKTQIRDTEKQIKNLKRLR